MKTKLFVAVMLMALVSHAELADDAHAQLSPAEAAKVIRLEAQAKAADLAVTNISAGDAQVKKQMYEISEKVMPWLLETTQGDETRMMQLIEEAKGNPEAFLKRLPANIQADVLNVTQQIERSRGVRSIP